MSRFVDASESMLSEQDDADESFTTQDGAPRRLRIFHDITQRNAGKSNETQKVISQAQGLLDWTSHGDDLYHNNTIKYEVKWM